MSVTVSAFGLTRTASADVEKHTVRFATLAPKKSPEGKIFRAWENMLASMSSDRIALRVQWNGTAGPDSTVSEKITSGKLDGATLGIRALSSLYRDIYVVELPGVAEHWMDAEIVQREIRPDLEIALGRAGIKFIGWGEWGAVRLLTRGYTASWPRDLARRRVATPLFDEDPVVEELFDEVGATVDGRALDPPVDTALAGAFGIPSDLSSFDYVDDQILWFGSTGAFVLAKRLGESLPADLATIVDTSARQTSKVLVQYSTVGRAAANQKLLSTMKVVRHTPAQTTGWQKVLRDVVERLAQGAIDKGVVNRVLKARHLLPVP